jgi:hypothetical protein
VPRGKRDGSLRPYSRISRQEPLLFLRSGSSVLLTRLNGHRLACNNDLNLFFASFKTLKPLSHEDAVVWNTANMLRCSLSSKDPSLSETISEEE